MFLIVALGCILERHAGAVEISTEAWRYMKVSLVGFIHEVAVPDRIRHGMCSLHPYMPLQINLLRTDHLPPSVHDTSSVFLQADMTEV
jgi:hypothetical protein